MVEAAEAFQEVEEFSVVDVLVGVGQEALALRWRLGCEKCSNTFGHSCMNISSYVKTKLRIDGISNRVDAE